MARVKNSKGLYSVLNDYSNSKNSFIETKLNDKNSLIETKGKHPSVRPGNIVSSTDTNNDQVSEPNRLEKDNAQESFINNELPPQKSSYNLLKQKSNEKLLLSPLSPSAFSRSTKIRFRCPSVDLIVSPSTASAYSSEDCAEVSVDSWEDDSPLDDEYNLLFGEKNEFPLSYSIMDETSELHGAELETSIANDIAIKKQMNGHVQHNDDGDGGGSRRPSKVEDGDGSRRASKVEEHNDKDSTAGSRRSSKVDENGSTHSAVGSRRTSKVEENGSNSATGSRRASKVDENGTSDSAVGSRRTSKVDENGTTDSAVGSRRTSKAESTKSGGAHEENGDNVENYDAIGEDTENLPNDVDNEHAEDGAEEPTRKLSTISAKSEGEHEVSKATAVPDEDNKEVEEEEFRRVSVSESTTEHKEEEKHQEDIENVQDGQEGEHESEAAEGHNESAGGHDESAEGGNDEAVEETVEEIEAHEEPVENGVEPEAVEQEVKELESSEAEERAEAVEDDTAKSERGSDPGEEVEASEQIEELDDKQEDSEQTKEDQNEEQPLVNGNANEIEEAPADIQPAIFSSPKTKQPNKSSGSPRKGLKPTSPRHVGGPPLRGRPRGAIRAAVPAPSSTTTNDSRLNQSWNSNVRRTQSQSPGRSTSEDFNKSAKTIDLHSIFGKTDAQLERKRQREEVSQKKRAEEEEKLLAEKEQRRKDAEAAFQSWLRRKAQERRRARSTGRGSTQSQERNEEDKHKNRDEAEQAFQAWLERKKEEQKERKRQFMTASKSQQQLSNREDADEAFRQWKEQKNQQRREERMLIRSQLRELQSIVPIDKYGDSSRSLRRINYSYHSQNGLPKLNNYRTISPANKKRVVRSDSLPSINSPDGGGTVKVT